MKKYFTKYRLKGVVVNTSGNFESYVYENVLWYEYNNAAVTVYNSIPPKVNSHSWLLFYEDQFNYSQGMEIEDEDEDEDDDYDYDYNTHPKLKEQSDSS